MREFAVWAPQAASVELDRGGQRTPMAADAGGWWRSDAQSPRDGDRYGFSIDAGPVRPDPRSPSQPDGVHAASQVVDHDSFAWTDARWGGFHLPGSVLYELHVGTFSEEGTFDGVVGHLEHLASLGVDAIEVMPVAGFDGQRGWGYDGVALYAPHAAYGGVDGLQRMVDACHSAGIGVVLDVVYNHLGPSGNYLREFGPYFSAVHRTNWGDGVNLDGPASDEVRRFFIDNALMWFRDFHIDGLRLDAVHALADDSAVHFLEQLADEVDSLSAHLGRPLTLIAESDLNDPRFVRPSGLGGYGLDSAWADEWHHAWHAVFTGETNGYYEDFGSVDHLAKALRQAWVYDGVWSGHRQRTHGRAPEGLRGEQFVVCTQNHDQIGNRAAGERSSALMSRRRLKVAAGLLLTSPFVTMLFQGEEWGAGTPWQYFTDFADSDLARAVTEGRRSEFSSFGWEPEDVPDPQDRATFDRSRLDWSELDLDSHREILDWYRTLIGLRRSLPALTAGDLQQVVIHTDPHHGALVMEHLDVAVAAVLGGRPVRAAVEGYVLVAASDDDATMSEEALRMAPDTLVVLRRPREAKTGGGCSGRRTGAPRPAGPAPWIWMPA